MNLSVTAPLSSAFRTTERILLTTFDAVKWLKLAFCAFLATLASNCNGSGGVQFRGSGRVELRRATDWLDENAALAITVGSVLFAVGLVIYVVFTWLQSRGRFMFLDGVARNRGAVSEPWNEHRAEAWSLFRVTVAIYVATALLSTAAIGVGGFLAWDFLGGGRLDGGAIAGLVIAGGTVFVLGVAVAIVDTLLNDFVAPAMYLRRVGVGAAWGAVSAEVTGGCLGTIVLYLLMKLVIAILCGALTLGLVCVTLCCAACFLAIPYVGTVVLLPLLVFQRAYSLHFLQQLGGAWDVFARAGDEPGAPVLGPDA